jgi:hypothetical protein
VEVSTLLHGNDSELIFFVNPDEEGLLIVVEDTSALWPFSVQVASFQESVSLPIINFVNISRNQSQIKFHNILISQLCFLRAKDI